MLVYSQPGKPKLRNIETNPHVAVALRTDPLGSELAVITGDAIVDRSAPKADDHAEYIESTGRKSRVSGRIRRRSPMPTLCRFASRRPASAPSDVATDLALTIGGS